MKATVSKYDFRKAFEDYNRQDNFSYAGLDALFEYLEQFEEETDEEIELDVIALCCDFMEETIDYILDYYSLETLEELQDNTTVIYVGELENWKHFDRELDGDKRIIIQAF